MLMKDVMNVRITLLLEGSRSRDYIIDLSIIYYKYYYFYLPPFTAL
jgi:hypothetical protein